MLKIKIGKGAEDLKRYECPLGTLSANPTEKMKTRTLNSIAGGLAKQLKIKNGEIVITSIEFSYSKEIAASG